MIMLIGFSSDELYRLHVRYIWYALDIAVLIIGI